jgi:hypothetical protein
MDHKIKTMKLKSFNLDRNEFPTQEQLENQNEFEPFLLTKKNSKGLLIYYNPEDKTYSIFEDLGEDAGSDDDPIQEIAFYDDIEPWIKHYFTGIPKLL